MGGRLSRGYFFGGERFRGKGDDHCSGFLAENEGEGKKLFSFPFYGFPQGEKVPVKTGSRKWNISFFGLVVDGLWRRRKNWKEDSNSGFVTLRDRRPENDPKREREK